MPYIKSCGKASFKEKLSAKRVDEGLALHAPSSPPSKELKTCLNSRFFLDLLIVQVIVKNSLFLNDNE